MSKKYYISLFASLLGTFAAFSAPVSPEAALANVKNFIGQSGSTVGLKKVNNDEKLQLAHTFINELKDTPAIYVFNRGTDSGYILAAADDRLPAIIGYSNSGKFDSSEMPANMEAMMLSWQSQIDYLLSNPNAKALTLSAPDHAIEPLLTSTWDQGSPYNRKCPTVTQYNSVGDANGTGPAAVGCVATALGQIMRHNQWPEVGSGSIKYTSKGDDTVEIDVNFEGHKYDWSKMPGSLTNNSDPEEIEQVSTLLYHVGAAFESIYGASTGATDVSVAPALKTYFGYDKGISYRLRDYYTDEEWNNIIFNELNENRPIAYGGVTKKEEGHFFVLDGVDAAGYYHINWGWSGMEDGYYLLSLLEPGQQGIGGADSGSAFHYYQNMITGIRKPGAEPSAEQIDFTADYLTTTSKTVDRMATNTVRANNVWNNSATPCTANLGFALINSEGQVVYRQWVKEATEYPISHGEETLKCSFAIPAEIEEGVYTIRPVYQVSADDYSTDHFIRLGTGRNDRYTVTVTENNIKYATTGAYKLTMLDVVTDTESIESGVPTKFTVKLRNGGGEFHGFVQLRLFIKGKDKVFGTTTLPKKALFVNIPEGESELEFNATLDVPGSSNYVFRLWGNEQMTDEDGYSQSAKNLCQKEGFKIIGPALPPVLSLSGDLIGSSAVNGVMPINDVSIKAFVENEGGAWTGDIRVAVWEEDAWRAPLGYIEYKNISIDGETEMWIDLMDGEFPEGVEIGKKYDLIIKDPVEGGSLVPSYYNSLMVEVGEPVAKDAELSIVDFSTYQPGEKIMKGDLVTFTFEVENKGYRYDGPMTMAIHFNNEAVLTTEPTNATIDNGTTALVEFEHIIDLPATENYEVRLLDNKGNLVGSPNYIEVADLSGVNEISAESITIENGIITAPGAEEIILFTADGRKAASAQSATLSTKNLADGVYLVIVRKENQSATIKFVK